MRERRAIIKRWEEGNAAALVTLVRVQGSSYRRTGARLLVTSDGSNVGAISGGCLEAEGARKARWTARSGAIVERFSTAFDDTPEPAALWTAMRESLPGQRRNVVTWLPESNQSLRRAVYDESGTTLFES